MGPPLLEFAAGDRFYATATVEPYGEGPTFDITVENVHEYLVNSLIIRNSGGKTRRAAKMVILDADHPNVEDFIWCKAVEERKARVLRDAGFDMDLDGKDSHSTQYQNANNSVRVTDEFMQAVLDDADWHTPPSPAATSSTPSRPATCSARSPRPPGSAPTPASSTTPPSTAGTPPPTPAASTPPTRAVNTCTSTTRRATWPR